MTDPNAAAFDAAVIGAGPAGIATGLALAHIGARVVLAGPPPKVRVARPETRTAALLTSSVDFLKRLNVWEALAPHAAPLKAIRIVDASRSPLRSQDIVFEAKELGLDAFGYNIANTVLSEALYARAQIVLARLAPETVKAISIDDVARVTLADGSFLSVCLIAGADGRNSVCREAAGIEADETPYDQAAIASSFRHALPHDGVSTEVHREGGSVTSVPTPDPLVSSLIWVGGTAEIEALTTCNEEDFAANLQERLGDRLGKVSDPGPRASFPVIGLTAKRLAANRTALVGEAAHVLPPIGAQGLNLGLRDAGTLADCVADARRHGGDPGGPAVLASYARARQLDVMSRTVGVDFLNRSLLTGLLPVQAARGAVLAGLNAFAPLRRLVMRIGLTPPASLPSLMRPDPRAQA